MLYNILRPIARILCRIIFNFKVSGLENLPSEDGYILSGNHIHNFDAVVVAVDIKRHIHFMAKDSLFKYKITHWLFTNLYGIPVRREDSDIKALKMAMKVLKNNEILGLFPEGTRNKTDKEMLEPKAGVVLLATRMKVPIVPVGIKGDYKFRKPLYINYGKPIYLDEYYGQKLSSEDCIEICKDKVYSEIIKLKNN